MKESGWLRKWHNITYWSTWTTWQASSPTLTDLFFNTQELVWCNYTVIHRQCFFSIMTIQLNYLQIVIVGKKTFMYSILSLLNPTKSIQRYTLRNSLSYYTQTSLFEDRNCISAAHTTLPYENQLAFIAIE